MKIFNRKFDITALLIVVVFAGLGIKVLVTKSMGIPGGGLQFSYGLENYQAYLVGGASLLFAFYVMYVAIKHAKKLDE